MIPTQKKGGLGSCVKGPLEGGSSRGIVKKGKSGVRVKNWSEENERRLPIATGEENTNRRRLVFWTGSGSGPPQEAS